MVSTSCRRASSSAPADDLARQERLGGGAQQALLARAADLHPRGERVRELGDHGVEERDAHLQRVDHRDGVSITQELVTVVPAQAEAAHALYGRAARDLVEGEEVAVERAARLRGTAQLR